GPRQGLLLGLPVLLTGFGKLGVVAKQPRESACWVCGLESLVESAEAIQSVPRKNPFRVGKRTVMRKQLPQGVPDVVAVGWLETCCVHMLEALDDGIMLARGQGSERPDEISPAGPVFPHVGQHPHDDL